MKKMLLPILLSLFIFLIPNYALSPEITVTPEKCLVNNTVYVIFQWRAPYNVEDFNVTVYSDAVLFKNSTLCYAGVAEDALIFHIFKGKAIKPGIHAINVQMSYFGNGIHKKEKYTLYVSILQPPKNNYITYKSNNNTSLLKNTTENITKRNIINISKLSKSIQNNSIPNSSNGKLNETNITKAEINMSKKTNLDNITNVNASKNITQKVSNTSTQTNENLKEDENNNWLMYGIFGLVIGIIFGFVVMYIIKI